MSHANIAHWDEVEEHDHQAGSIHSRWRYLGEAAGTVGVGVNRIRIDPGCRSTPLHSHGDHEEIFYVLGGSGLSWQRDGDEDVVCEVGAGTCIVHLATGPAHTLVAGPDGLDVLAYGNGRRSGGGSYDWFPRIDKLGVGPSLLDVDQTPPVGARGRALRAGAAGAGRAARERRPARGPRARSARPRRVRRLLARARRGRGLGRDGPEPLRDPAREAQLPRSLPLLGGGGLRRPRGRRAPASSATKSTRSGRARWSPGRRARASATPSAPARPG